MIRFKVAAACLALGCVVPLAAPGSADGGSTGFDIDVLQPVDGSAWSGERMRGAHERLKDVLPGKRG